MAVKNDERILILKAQIEKKKNEINSKKKKIVPRTNLILEWRKERKNLNVLSLEELVFLGWELSSLNEYVKKLGLKEFLISGYDINDWIFDIDQKRDLISIKKEEAELNESEKKLNKLLSEDKKTELELDSIASLLGE